MPSYRSYSTPWGRLLQNHSFFLQSRSHTRTHANTQEIQVGNTLISISCLPSLQFLLLPSSQRILPGPSSSRRFLFSSLPPTRAAIRMLRSFNQTRQHTAPQRQPTTGQSRAGSGNTTIPRPGWLQRPQRSLQQPQTPPGIYLLGHTLNIITDALPAADRGDSSTAMLIYHSSRSRSSYQITSRLLTGHELDNIFLLVVYTLLFIFFSSSFQRSFC